MSDIALHLHNELEGEREYLGDIDEVIARNIQLASIISLNAIVLPLSERVNNNSDLVEDEAQLIIPGMEGIIEASTINKTNSSYMGDVEKVFPSNNSLLLAQLQELRESQNVKILNIENNIEESRHPYDRFHKYYAEEFCRAFEQVDMGTFQLAVDAICDTVLKKDSDSDPKRKIYTMGNGGSAAIANHAAHNLNWDASGGVSNDLKLSAFSFAEMATDVLARGNDRASAYVFSTLIESHLQPGDVVIGISASGESDNVVKAFERVSQRNIQFGESKTVSIKPMFGQLTKINSRNEQQNSKPRAISIFIGKPDSTCSKLADISIEIPSDDQQVIEDVTQSIVHMIVRAASVKLMGVARTNLWQSDLAHLRTKDAALRQMATELGLPSEVKNLMKTGFKDGLVEVGEQRILAEANKGFSFAKSVTISELAPDFTSMVRLVTVTYKHSRKIRKVVAKLAWNKTLPRFVDEDFQGGPRRIAALAFETPNQDVEDEYKRTHFLANVFKSEGFVRDPLHIGNGVLFLPFFEGKTLEKYVIEDTCPETMHAVGEALRIWHDKLSNRVTKGMKFDTLGGSFKGDLDRVIRFGVRFLVDQENNYQKPVSSFGSLFSNGHVKKDKRDSVENLIRETIRNLDGCNVMSLQRDTLVHGDFKPENIIVDKKENKKARISIIDNALHSANTIEDVGKMISRCAALCFSDDITSKGEEGKILVLNSINQFLVGYGRQLRSDAESVDYIDNIAKYIALDLMCILQSYTKFTKSDLPTAPKLAQSFLDPKNNIDLLRYIHRLSSNKITTLSELIP
jgi:phosphoheptose isomerase